MKTIQQFCQLILDSGDLRAKLQRPVQDGQNSGEVLIDDFVDEAGVSMQIAPRYIDAPMRGPQLAMASGAEKLPTLGQIQKDSDARLACLRRFAHHELMAVELFAAAILAYPQAPASLRRAWLQALSEEQEHCRFYLDAAARILGVDAAKDAEKAAEPPNLFGDAPLSDYFWQNANTLWRHPEQEKCFLSAMGLTLEQANLDFTLLYRDAFRQAGDMQTAAAIQQVHNDEIQHVKLAMIWLRKLKNPDDTDVMAYQKSVPFPLSAARAKARRFDIAARKKAGLHDDMIAWVRDAKPYQETQVTGLHDEKIHA